MPNTGQPSKDCHLCRQRRVKCDLARPFCQRCIRYGAACPGYRDQQDLVFRHETPTQIKRRIKRAGETGVSPASSGGLSEASSVTSSTPASPVIRPFLMTRPIHEHWTVHSVPILLEIYSSFNFVGNMYRADPGDGPLIWAAHLFSRTYVTNLRYPTAMSRDSYAQCQRELGAYLGKTLSALASALGEGKGVDRDDVLLTVWIMANYELLVGSVGRYEMTSSWHTHARGLYSILKTRGLGTLESQAGRGNFWAAYSMVQIQALSNNLPCPNESEEWFAIIRGSLKEGEAVALIVSGFIKELAEMQALMLQLIRSGDLDQLAEQYASIVSRITQAKVKADIDFAQAPPFTDPVETYWRQTYCTAIVKGYHIIHLYINALSHSPTQPYPLDKLNMQRDHCLDMVRTSAQEIIDFIPVILEPLRDGRIQAPHLLFDALKSIWPLSIVYATPTTLSEQKHEAEMALLFVGRSLGIRQALSAYPGGSRVPVMASEPVGFGECENVHWVGRLR